MLVIGFGILESGFCLVDDWTDVYWCTIYIQCKDGNTECTFPAIKDPAQLMISHAKSSKVC